MPRTTPRARRTLWCLVLLTAVLLGACSDDAKSALAGTYTHQEEGTLVLKDDGTATLTQSGDPVDLTYTVDGDTLTFTATSNSKTVTATHKGDDIVFEAGAFSGDGETTFTRK